MQTEVLLKNYYEYFNNGEAEKFLALLSDDVLHEVNQSEAEHGKSAFRAFVKMMDECYEETASDISITVSKDGQRAAAEFQIDGIYLKTVEGLPEATGQNYRLRVGTFFEIKNNKITRVTNYYNLPDWLEQVGG